MRRRLADEIGREVAGVVLGRYSEFGMGRVGSGGNGDNDGVVEGLGDDASPVATAAAPESSSGTTSMDLGLAARSTAATATAASPPSSLATTTSTLSTKQWQQAHLLEREEADWPSSFWKEKEKEKQKQKLESETEAEGGSENRSGNENEVGSSSSSSTVPKESVWAYDIVLDERIARRMKRFVFDG